jgi:hypothetical protein
MRCHHGSAAGSPENNFFLNSLAKPLQQFYPLLLPLAFQNTQSSIVKEQPTLKSSKPLSRASIRLSRALTSVGDSFEPAGGQALR